MRIAVISVHGSPLTPPGSREAGGMNVFLREISRELSQRGVEVDLFTRRTGTSGQQVVSLAELARVIELKAGPVGPVAKEDLYPYLPEFLARVLRFQAKEGRDYDLIYSHYWLSGWVALRLRQSWGVPVVAMFHTLARLKTQARAGESESPVRIATERRILAEADAVVVASPEEPREIARLYEVTPRRVQVVPCGVDLDAFRPMDAREARDRLGLNGNRTLLFVGRMEPLKGLDILLRAFAELEDPKAELIVLGGDEGSVRELARTQALARELGIDARVRFGGSVDHASLPDYYNAADVCVVPSYYESFGMVALEALACGTPVVAARVGGLRHTVRDGENGFLVPWHCPEPFTQRLELLLDNADLRREFGVAGRQTARAYGWPQVAERTVELFHDLIGSFHGAQTGAGPSP